VLRGQAGAAFRHRCGVAVRFARLTRRPTRRSGAGRDQLTEQLLDALRTTSTGWAGGYYGAEAGLRAAGRSPTKASSIQATR
jgi:hypothetical protein